MSHVATVNVVIKDLGALAKAAQALGLELKVRQKTYKWYGTRVRDYNAGNAAYKNGIKPEDYGKCEHAIAVKGNPDAYEVGVVKNPAGEGFVLAWDFWNGGNGLMAKVGKDCEKLRQGYAAEVAIKKAKQAGYTVKKEIGQDGKIRLTCTQ